MSESTARQLFELAFAFVTGAALGAMRFPVYILRQVFYRLAALWDVIFYALAGLAVFAAGQWCSGGVRPRFLTAALSDAPLHVPSDPAPRRCAALRSGNASIGKNSGAEKKMSGKKREKKMKKFEKYLCKIGSIVYNNAQVSPVVIELPRQGKRRRESMSKSIKFLFGCILSILLVYASARYVTTAIRVEEAELLLRETRERCEALEQSNAALRERIERSGDADRIAELARERLGLVLPDDRIYQ